MRVQATLPTLGAVPVDFHRESADVLSFMGERELDRLGSVPHLGVASAVFTGVNHSRLEYVLLQCAIIGLVAKLHRHDEAFALSNGVRINGLRSDVSSGEELLKCWTLLSNFGHAQYTYGVERAILRAARGDALLHNWLTTSTRSADLRKWCRETIKAYRDENVHFLLSLNRIALGASHDRRKRICVHYLRNLLLPVDNLFPGDHPRQYKLARLRQLFGRIRLLSIATLDSYYSHHPLRIQLTTAVVSLAELSAAPGEDSGFERILREAAGWLADELYLHSSATTVQRAYERRAEAELSQRFAKVAKSPRRLSGFVKNFMWNGFGKPSTDVLAHLVRLTFPVVRQPMLGRSDLFETQKQLEAELVAPPRTHATIDKNRYSRAVHLDLLYDTKNASPQDVACVYARVMPWLVRSLEADALARFRGIFRVEERSEAARAELLRRFVNAGLQQDRIILSSLFQSVLRYLLPDDRKGVLGEMMHDDPLARPVWAKVTGTDGEVYDQISSEIVRQLDENPRSYGADRLQEIRALQGVVKRSRAPFLLGCMEKFVVRDQFGKSRHDWDGVLVEISDAGVCVRIVEAKNRGGRTRNENMAMEQLRLSIGTLCQRRGLTYRRTRLRGVGAVMSCTMRV